MYNNITYYITENTLELHPFMSTCEIDLNSTVAHRGHRFNKEKTLQIKKFLANINNMLKKSSPAHWKQKRNCKKIHAHYKQKNYTLQTKLPHTANKTPAHCQQKNYALQTKELHPANKTPAHCKQNYSMLQTKLPHTANKTPAHCLNKRIICCKENSCTLQTKAKVLHAKDDVKDWDLVSWFSLGGVFTERD